ncbi:MAG TPA: hypothetical protein VFL63_12325 [Rhodanobacteraceae bacterium]|nr:hypothetical protein [Rhodanobacteraceae bacterium]
MKLPTQLLLAMTAGAALAAGGHANAQTTAAIARPAPAHALLQEIPDPDLATMRGRFRIGNNTVAYFGVSMLSTWTTASGQALSGSLTLGMDFTDGHGAIPVITFTPTMNIVQGTAIPAPIPNGSSRTVDGAGLANVNGLVQGIQIAGSGNHAVNVTALDVRRGGGAPGSGDGTSATTPFDTQVSSGDASVAIAFDPAKGVSMNLGVAGQGMVSQWIRSGSVGQLVQLNSDGQAVSNQLRLDLVLDGAAAPNRALRDASQALLMSRLVGAGG